MIGNVDASDGSPTVTYGMSAVRPAARSRAKVVSMRFTAGAFRLPRGANAHGFEFDKSPRVLAKSRLHACVAERAASRSATVFMSLSPRPERLTSRMRSFAIVAASFVAYASA